MEEKREKSNMELWAEEEIRIACERERGGTSEDEWDYGVACYESALKAFRSLAEDGHSGMSIGITLNILNRLVKGQPLTPIADTDDVWEECVGGRASCTTYQCRRMSSLFKDVYADGHIEYSDVNRFICRTLESSACWHNGYISRIAGEYFPISMPYIPRTYTVICEEFLTDRKNGDFDTIGILYILDSAGKRKEVNRYFAEAEAEEGWREIELPEYEQRRQMDAERRKEEEENENFEMQTDND